MAPEQMDPHLAPCSTKSDVFAFGGFLIELFGGTHPWGNLQRREIEKDVLNAVLPMELKKVTATSVNTLIRKCMNFQPSQRPDMDTVLTDLIAMKM